MNQMLKIPHRCTTLFSHPALPTQSHILCWKYLWQLCQGQHRMEGYTLLGKRNILQLMWLDYDWTMTNIYIWGDGSVVKSIACSSTGPEFKSQQPHGGSQPSVMRSGARICENILTRTDFLISSFWEQDMYLHFFRTKITCQKIASFIKVHCL